MNVEGVVAVVHGGRAGQPSTEGIPVPFSLRQVLERAHSTPEAIEIAKSQRVMVSHILFVADSEGRFAVVERAPNAAPYVRGGAETIAVTNHFEGPLAADPKNIAIRRTTTTLARRVRAEELLSAIEPHSATPARVLSILRDHRCAGDASCALGDRRAIDALVATHGIVADTTDRILWVSAGPALSGKFVRLDLRVLLAPDHDPAADVEPETLPEDPTVGSMRRPNGAPKE